MKIFNPTSENLVIDDTAQRDKITAIIPIDLTTRGFDIFLKSLRMAKEAENEKFHLIFGHNDRGTVIDKLFLKLLSKYRYCTVVSGKYYHEGINSSLLRNIAFEKVTSEQIILLDIDIWPDFKLIHNYSNKISLQLKPFYILPCLYLTEFGSKLLTKNKTTPIKLIEKYFRYSRKEFLHLASPSSITIMKADDYREIKGFDSNFNGHGFEDFDFLIRLYEHYVSIPNTRNFMLDKKARSPLFSGGFRRYLGELCLDALINKEIMLHIHHKRESSKNYYESRIKNYNLLLEKHSHLVGGDDDEHENLIPVFLKFCASKKIDIQEYSILFDNKPGHIDKFDTFKKRFKFVFNR